MNTPGMPPSPMGGSSPFGGNSSNWQQMLQMLQSGQTPNSPFNPSGQSAPQQQPMQAPQLQMTPEQRLQLAQMASAMNGDGGYTGGSGLMSKPGGAPTSGGFFSAPNINPGAGPGGLMPLPGIPSTVGRF